MYFINLLLQAINTCEVKYILRYICARVSGNSSLVHQTGSIKYVGRRDVWSRSLRLSYNKKEFFYAFILSLKILKTALCIFYMITSSLGGKIGARNIRLENFEVFFAQNFEQQKTLHYVEYIVVPGTFLNRIDLPSTNTILSSYLTLSSGKTYVNMCRAE